MIIKQPAPYNYFIAMPESFSLASENDTQTQLLSVHNKTLKKSVSHFHF